MIFILVTSPSKRPYTSPRKVFCLGDKEGGAMAISGDDAYLFKGKAFKALSKKERECLKNGPHITGVKQSQRVAECCINLWENRPGGYTRIAPRDILATKRKRKLRKKEQKKLRELRKKYGDCFRLGPHIIIKAGVIKMKGCCEKLPWVFSKYRWRWEGVRNRDRK